MFSALAARIAERRRGLPSGSPPPPLAATAISLSRRVNILPRLASSAPFLCLIVAHFEWPDMGTSANVGRWRRNHAPDLVSIPPATTSELCRRNRDSWFVHYGLPDVKRQCVSQYE